MRVVRAFSKDLEVFLSDSRKHRQKKLMQKYEGRGYIFSGFYSIYGKYRTGW